MKVINITPEAFLDLIRNRTCKFYDRGLFTDITIIESINNDYSIELSDSNDGFLIEIPKHAIISLMFEKRFEVDVYTILL